MLGLLCKTGSNKQRHITYYSKCKRYKVEILGVNTLTDIEVILYEKSAYTGGRYTVLHTEFSVYDLEHAWIIIEDLVKRYKIIL